MTAINATNAVALFIREQGIGRRRDAAAAAKSSAGTTVKPAPGQAHQDIAALVFRRIRFIEPTDPDRRRKAFRIFIESVLLVELGEDLINDPKFYELVSEVESRMRADPSLAKSIDDAAEMLVAQAN